MSAEHGALHLGLRPIASVDRTAPDVVAFTTAMADRHRELRRVIGWREFTAIAERERVPVRVVPLSRPARLLRLGRHVQIQLQQSLSRNDRARFGMHELAHYWRDDPGENCYHADDHWGDDPAEDFANMFAWYVTSLARVHIDEVYAPQLRRRPRRG